MLCEIKDCSIEGQVYQEGTTDCPRTCDNPYLLCSGTGHDGCTCPSGQVIDEKNRRCVDPTNCPSKCYNLKNIHNYMLHVYSFFIRKESM